MIDWFGKRARAAERELQLDIRQLREDLQALRHQVAGLSIGIPVPASAIYDGAAAPEIPSAEVEQFLQRTANVLILDVRTDARWTARHIDGAKHVPVGELLMRLGEMPSRAQPIVVMSEQGNEATIVAEQLLDAGYRHVFVAGGGMAAYTGAVVTEAAAPIAVDTVQGPDRALIAKIAGLLDRDVRPSLHRDGGDLQLVAVDAGVVRIKMVGACHGCGAQKQTLQHGIRSYLQHMVPEILSIEQVQ